MSSVPSQYTVLTPKGRLKIEEYYLYRLACITDQVKEIFLLIQST